MPLILVGWRPKGFESRRFWHNPHDQRLVHLHRRTYLHPRSARGAKIREQQRRQDKVLPG